MLDHALEAQLVVLDHASPMPSVNQLPPLSVSTWG
jgi:hypothetical protein